jgi:hypothetical protein
MEHSVQEVTFHHEPGGNEVVKKIIKTTVILSVITVIELGLGLAMYAFPMADALKLFLKGAIVITCKSLLHRGSIHAPRR